MVPGILRRDNCPLLILKYLSQDLLGYLAYVGVDGEDAQVGSSAVDDLLHNMAAAAAAGVTMPAGLAAAPSPLLTLGNGGMPQDDSAPWTLPVPSADTITPVSPLRTARPQLESPQTETVSVSSEGPARGQQVPASGDLALLSHDCPPSASPSSYHVRCILSAGSGSFGLETCEIDLTSRGRISPVVFPTTGLPVSRRRLATICMLLRILHMLTKDRQEYIAADLVNYK